MRILLLSLLALALTLPASAAPIGVRVAAHGGLASYAWHTVAPFALGVTYRLGPVEVGVESSASVMSGSDAHPIAACWGLALVRASRPFGSASVFVQGGAGLGVLIASRSNDTVLVGRGGTVARAELGLEVPSGDGFLELAGGVVSFGNVATGGHGETAWPEADRGVARVQMLTFRIGAGVRF